MLFGDLFLGLPLLTPGIDHMPQQGDSLSQMTVNPADLLLTQPTHVPTQSYVIPNTSLASVEPSTVGSGVVGNIPQGASLYLPLAQTVPFMGHTSGDFFITSDILAGHVTSVPISARRTSRGSSTRCMWMTEGQSVCDQAITGRTLPKHLAEHGIRKMHKDLTVQCCWLGCGTQVKRHGIARHAREVHLGLKRNSTRNAFAWDTPGH